MPKTKNLLRPEQINDTKGEVSRLERMLDDPRAVLEDPKMAAKQLHNMKKILHEETPTEYSGLEKDNAEGGRARVKLARWAADRRGPQGPIEEIDPVEDLRDRLTVDGRVEPDSGAPARLWAELPRRDADVFLEPYRLRRLEVRAHTASREGRRRAAYPESQGYTEYRSRIERA